MVFGVEFRMSSRYNGYEGEKTMSVGEKIRKLRKQRDWTQDELGAKIGVHGRHVTRLEKNIYKPSAKTLARLAEVFEISVDELAQENGNTRAELLIPDPELFAQFQAIAHLGEDDKRAVKTILQAMITKEQVKSLINKQ